jgi:hypothetical protein
VLPSLAVIAHCLSRKMPPNHVAIFPVNPTYNMTSQRNVQWRIERFIESSTVGTLAGVMEDVGSYFTRNECVIQLN